MASSAFPPPARGANPDRGKKQAQRPAQRKPAQRPAQPSGGQSPKEQQVLWAIVFVGVLVTYVTYMVLLLPRGYDLWVALAGATTTCIVAGHVTRTIVMVSVDQGVVSATAPRSLVGRTVAFALRAAMADSPSRDAGRQGLNGEEES